MSLTLKPGAMKYRDPDDGQYKSVDVVAEKTTSELVADITDAADDQVDRVEAAGTAAVALFPDTYEAVDTLSEDLAPTYDPTATYDVGEFCTYQYQLYKCNQAITTPESSFVAAHWDAVDVSDELNDVMSHLRVVVTLADVNGSDLWANGAISATTGENVNNDARIRTASALAPDILQIKNSDAAVWKYMIFAYTSNTVFDSTTYVGAWFPNNQTKFAKSTSWITGDTDIATLDANYPSGITKLYYRITVAKQESGQIINKNDDYTAIQLIGDAIKVDKTLTKSGVPADAKAVSDAIAVIPGKNLAYYQLENKCVHDFLNDDSLIDDTSYTYSVVENYIDRTYRLYSGAIRRDHPAPIRNVFNSIDNLGAGESPDNQVVGIWVSDDNFGHYQYFKATGNYIEINNLIPERTYKYRVYGFTNTFEDRLIASGSFITNGGVRMCNVPGIQNVRDLGGWTGLDSRKVIYGNLYRGCELAPEGQDDVVGAKIWDEGIEICRNNLKIRSELDISTIDRQESLFGADIEYMQIDAGSYDQVITSSYYRNHFKQMFEWIIKQLYDFSNMSLSAYDSQSNYNEGDYCLYGPYDKVIYQATQDIEAEPWTEAHWMRIKYGTAPRPIYFHCQGGNDRTGTLSALLLALLGVNEFTISQEYELSAFSKIGFSRRRNSNNYKGLINALKTAGESNDIGTAAYNWATTLSEISDSDINTFRSLMLNAID